MPRPSLCLGVNLCKWAVKPEFRLDSPRTKRREKRSDIPGVLSPFVGREDHERATVQEFDHGFNRRVRQTVSHLHGVTHTEPCRCALDLGDHRNELAGLVFNQDDIRPDDLHPTTLALLSEFDDPGDRRGHLVVQESRQTEVLAVLLCQIIEHLENRTTENLDLMLHVSGKNQRSCGAQPRNSLDSPVPDSRSIHC